VANDRYDVIIIGAGPNGLEAGAYLSKAGLKVLLLEKRHEVGGGLATELVTLPGFLHNTHAIYMMMVDYAPIFEHFPMEEKYEVKHVFPPLQFALPLSDGRSVRLYSDMEKTCQAFAAFSQHDADAYRELYQKAFTAVDEYIAAGTYVPPQGALDALMHMQQSETGRMISEFSMQTAKGLIDDTFENEHIKALLLYACTQWGLDYDQPAMGYLIALYLNRASNYRLGVGGSHRTAQVLHKIVHENGGHARNNQRIKRIIVENGKATGVEMLDGKIIEAEKAILSTIDQNQTFIKYVGEENLDSNFADKVKGWQWERYSYFCVHLAMDKAPNFTAAAANPDVNEAFVNLLGVETEDELVNELDALYRGDMPQKLGFNCCFPSIHDPIQAPPGRCTGLISLHVPYRLNGDAENWYNLAFKEELADRCLEILEKYAPGSTGDNILAKYIATPIDIENKFPDMVEGSIKQGLYTPFQMGFLRPNEECSLNSTPIENLYVGGASVYPGGCVIWGNGYLAASTILDKLGIEKWWPEPKCVTRSREAGLM